MTVSTDFKPLAEFVSSPAFEEGIDGLGQVVIAIADGARRVEEQVRLAGLADVLGSTGEVNVQGEIVQRLDTASSDIFVEVLRDSGRVAIVGCEELAEPVEMGETDAHRFEVLMDPLDGSSNIDVAVSIGSIFGIWERSETLLRPGNSQVAAVYVIYGSSTMLVTATRKGVHGFTLGPAGKNFRLTHPDLRIPDRCPYYSVNDGNWHRWEPGVRRAVDELREGRSQRYIGSLVADFHRNLLKGGVFLYPGDAKNPSGKLRLMYEANPLGFVAVQAGGAVSDGNQPILDLDPETLHQRTPLIVGNLDVVERIVQTIQKDKETQA